MGGHLPWTGDDPMRCLGCRAVDVPPPDSYCPDCAAKRTCTDCGGPKGHGRLWARCMECQHAVMRRGRERIRAAAERAGIDGDELVADIRRHARKRLDALRATHPTTRSESDGE